MSTQRTQYADIGERESIAEVFARRVRLTPKAVAYREYDGKVQDWVPYTWEQTAEKAGQVRAALAAEGLQPGERVAIMLRNCKEWVWFDQGACAQGLVTVPLYVEDRPENIAYCLNDAGVKLLVVEGKEHLERLAPVREAMPGVARIVTVKAVEGVADGRVRPLSQWLAPQPGLGPVAGGNGHELATIVYTSGTTGKPKGVMLSHQNMLQDARASPAAFDVFPDDLFLSFLPLSHMLERMGGYYLTMVAGATVAYARSVPQLAEDFRKVRPTVIISVPRIYERLHAAIHAQLAQSSGARRRLFEFAHRTGWDLFEWKQRRGRWKPSFLLWPVLRELVADKLLERLGGRLRVAVSGGAALNPHIAHTFLGLGLPICQGYGLTEASPVVSVNRLERNDPASIGVVLDGIQVRFGANGSLQVKGPNVMMGYWNNPEATAQVLSADGWLDTGDQARIEDGIVHITGRIKEIIVLANGEKVPPVDMELAIQLDPLLEQVLVLGEGKPFLAALVVVNAEEWQRAAQAGQVPPAFTGEHREKAEKLVVERIAEQVRSFPGYAQVRRVALVAERWTVDNGLLTPTLKPRRRQILERHAAEAADLYRGHGA